MAEELQALLRRIRSGDSAAFEALYLAHAQKIYSIAYRYCGNEADAQDVLQETMVKAWRSIGRFRGDSAVGTWLYRIAINCAKDHLRCHRSQAVSIDALQSSGFEPADEGFEGHSVEHAALTRALAQLPCAQRRILILRDVEGFSYEEIAAILRLPGGTVRSRLNRARQALRDIYFATQGTKGPVAASKHKKEKGE